MLLAFVMIVIGFLIMFRRQIDPHTVISIQNALPRIVLTLILITFSYAIVGLLIDLMYVILLLAYSLFESTGLIEAHRDTWFGGSNLEMQKAITQGNLFTVFHAIFPQNIVSIFDMSFQLFGIDFQHLPDISLSAS